MRIADFGLRIGPRWRRVERLASPIGPSRANPQSAIRNPQWFAGAVLLALFVSCKGDGRTPLVIYSPHGRDLLTLLEHRFEQLHPDVDVRWLDMGSQEVYERVRSERANPQADVWFGGPGTIFARGARDARGDRLRRTGGPARGGAPGLGRPPGAPVEGQDPDPGPDRERHDARGLGDDHR